MIPPPPPPYVAVPTTSPEMPFDSGRLGPGTAAPAAAFSSSSFGGYHPDHHHQPRSTVPLAYQMYERLWRMSDERKLNLSEEDVLISAYLGPNLVYRASTADLTSAAKATSSSSSVYGPLHVQTDALTL